MAHRRTLSTIQAMKLRQEKLEEHPVLSASGVGIGIAAALSAAATALAPALPLSAMRSSMSLDTVSSSAGTSVCDDDGMSLSSLDLYTPLTPGTPSKFFPHPPRFPSYTVVSPPSNAVTRARLSLRHFVSRALATLSPRAPVLPLKSPQLSPSSSSPYLVSLPTRTRAPIRRRATFFVLLALITLCIWTLFTSSLGDPQSRPIRRPYYSADGVLKGWKEWRNREGGSEEHGHLLTSASFRAAALSASPDVSADSGRLRKPHPGSPNTNAAVQLPPLELNPADELAALTAFIAALPWNALPAHIDPSVPLDPNVVLDFDPSHPRAHDEIVRLREETWQLNPVVLFGKARHAPTRETRAALETLGVNMREGQVVMDVEMSERVDADIVMGVLARLVASLESDSTTGKPEPLDLPLLLVGGQPIRGTDVPELVESGELARLLRDAGVRLVPGGGKKKKNGH